jgi:hypothetical protein
VTATQATFSASGTKIIQGVSAVETKGSAFPVLQSYVCWIVQGTLATMRTIQSVTGIGTNGVTVTFADPYVTGTSSAEVFIQVMTEYISAVDLPYYSTDAGILIGLYSLPKHERITNYSYIGAYYKALRSGYK